MSLFVFSLAFALALHAPSAGATPIAAAAPATAPSQSTPLPSVVSTNLCADLLLLRLADPSQIRSVSFQSQDPAQSPVAEHAARYPTNRGAVEELLYFRPEVALTYLGWSGRPHANLLEGRGIRVVALPYPRNLKDALAMTREIAHQIGRDPAAARELVRARARIDALKADASAQHRGYRALYLRPNGGTAGSDTYVDAMLELLGLGNLAAENGIRGWGNLPLEQLISDPPDLFLLGYFDQAQPPSKSAYGRHPLMAALLARIPSLRMPSNSAWGCGGLELIDAAEWISARIKTLDLPPATDQAPGDSRSEAQP